MSRLDGVLNKLEQRMRATNGKLGINFCDSPQVAGQLLGFFRKKILILTLFTSHLKSRMAV